MFCEDLQKRLALFSHEIYEVSDTQVHLTEKTKEGCADLCLTVHRPCILFRNLEHKKPGYFKNQKCSDYVIFESASGPWRLHIFELKRSVGKSEWTQIKKQFLGAVQNACALAGVLNIQIDWDQIYVYTVFRNDKFLNLANPAKERMRMYEHSSANEMKNDWNDHILIMDYPGAGSFKHLKIKLHIESGIGDFQLPEQK